VDLFHEGKWYKACVLSSFTGSAQDYDEDLLATYRREFGEDKVCWAPIEDFHLADIGTLKRILRFLEESDAGGERVVVHCYAGLGRTGQVLAAWLVSKYGLSPEDAVEAVIKMGRKPDYAVESRNATMDELLGLLDQCRNEGAV